MKPAQQRRKSLLTWLTASAASVAMVAVAVPGDASAYTLPNGQQYGHTIVRVGGTGDTGHGNYSGELRQYPPGTKLVPVKYPASFAPLGNYSYDDSVRMGFNAANKIVYSTPGKKTIIGASQGARIAGDVGRAWHLNPNTRDSDLNVIAIADPRAPRTGLEVVMHRMLPFQIPGATATGERGSMGGVKMTQVCLKYDPICDASGIEHGGLVGLVNAGAGYYLEHLGNGKYNYGNINRKNTVVWHEGNTTYERVNVPPPIQQLLDNANIPTSPQTKQFIRDISAQPGPFRNAPAPRNPVADVVNQVNQVVNQVVQPVQAPAPVPAQDPVNQAVSQVNTVVNQVNTVVQNAVPAAPVIPPAPKVVNDVKKQVNHAINNSPLKGIIPPIR